MSLLSDTLRQMERTDEATVRLDAYARSRGIRLDGKPEDDAATIAPVHHTEIAYRKFSAVTVRPVHWLIPGKIARGTVTTIAGHPGGGKSQVTDSFGATVSTGGLWPCEKVRAEVGNVIYLSAEDSAETTIKPRLQAAGADMERCFVLDAVLVINQDGEPSERSFNLAEDIKRLRAMIQEIGKVAVLVIDPVTAYLGGTDSHKNADIRQLLAPLAKLAEEFDLAVICVNHLNKSGNNDALLRVMGSLAFVAAARSAWIVAKDPENPSRRLFLPAKNNLGPDQTGLAFSIEGCALPGGIETSRVAWEVNPVIISANDVLMLEPAEDRSATDEAANLLRQLLNAGPVKAQDVQREARQAGISDKALRRARERLGITPRKTAFSGGWTWELSTEDAPNPQDAPLKEEGIFGIEGHLGELPEGVDV
ncbi:AAA family ATPase [Ferrovum sp.]|uniref:AAA family ATPase n=1 Tax=Ferrovum sp. TaxID=2609467 RepID=UPI00261A092F|nr:AAA family ATPase [Ferrovum sp.]